MTKQRIWQINQQQQGKCVICAKPAIPGKTLCASHRASGSTYARNRYRAKVGIPLNAPPQKRGPKPKKGHPIS